MKAIVPKYLPMVWFLFNLPQVVKFDTNNDWKNVGQHDGRQPLSVDAGERETSGSVGGGGGVRKLESLLVLWYYLVNYKEIKIKKINFQVPLFSFFQSTFHQAINLWTLLMRLIIHSDHNNIENEH